MYNIKAVETQNPIGTGIEVVITALTRNHSKYCAVLTIRTARKP